MLSSGWHGLGGTGWFGGLAVLTVAKVTRPLAAGYAEYLEGKAQPAELGDYYLKDGERVEAPGRWVQGAAAVAADPALAVSGDQLRALMAVRRPDTGAPLRRAGAGGETVAALDATFSAPKSVSAIWAIADADLRSRVEGAHELAIDRALEYAVERVAMVRQRVDQDTVIHAKPKLLVATSWRHTTARAVDGMPPDPQLHSHVLLHAAVRKDGQLVAIDSRSWLTHRRELGAAYRSELARELNQLGFEIQRCTGRGQRYFEIAGVPQALMDEWSSRHRQVQVAIRRRLSDQRQQLIATIAAGTADWEQTLERLHLLEQGGQLAPGEERLMATVTRSRKAPVTHDELDRHWRVAASRHGLDRTVLGRLASPRAPMRSAGQRELLAGLTEFDATFPARDARAVALERCAGAPIADALGRLQELRRAGELLVLADRNGTTREHRGREQQTVAIAARLADSTRPPLPANVVANEIRRLDRQLARQGGRLSDEQRHAIRLACGARALVVIEGHAGTGKSTTLIGIARAHQSAGRQIVVTSTAALAAERLACELSDAGVQADAYSTAALHAGITDGRIALSIETTVIHDEAALASTREQHQLLGAVDTAGARVIEVGDPRQNQPVGAGGLWPQLEQAATVVGARVELTDNQRALDPSDRRDQALFRQGHIERAIRGYAARDRVHLAADQSRAEDWALDAAHQDQQQGKSTIVIAQTSNEHLDELNARAQAIRIQHGELQPQSIPVPGRPCALHPGDQVQMRRTLPHPEHGPLRNGTSASVEAVDPRAATVTLRLSDGQTVTLQPEQLAAADLRLAYVQHPFPAQGQTTDTAHLIITEHTTREGSYVALTRARQEAHIHAALDLDAGTDRLATLSERMCRSEPALPSIRAPLAHEITVANDLTRAQLDPERSGIAPTIDEQPHVPASLVAAKPVTTSSTANDAWPHHCADAVLWSAPDRQVNSLGNQTGLPGVELIADHGARRLTPFRPTQPAADQPEARRHHLWDP